MRAICTLSTSAAGVIGLLAWLLSGVATAAVPAPFPVRHGAAVGAVAFSPDGRMIASGGDDAILRIADVSSGKVKHTLRGHLGRVASLAFAPDGKVLASGGRDSTVCLWGPVTGKQLHRLEGHERTVMTLAFTPDGRHLVSGSYDGTVRLWEVATGKEVLKLEAHQDAVSCVGFAPDGKTLASGGYDRVVRVWSLDAARGTAKVLQQLPVRHRTEVTGLAFCLGGRYLATSSANGFWLLWDVASGEVAEVLRPNGGTILTVASSADSRTLALGGLGGEVELYEAATGRLIGMLSAHSGEFDLMKFSPTTGYPSEIRAVALAAGGFVVAAGAKDGRVHVWDLSKALTRKEAIPARPEQRDLEKLWGTLGDADPAVGYRTVAVLASRPEAALAFLKQRLLPAPPPDRKRILQLIEELNDRRFAVRERASAGLASRIEDAEPLLREALGRKPSLELRRRIERLLDPLQQRFPPPDRLRASRALLAVERIGTAEARAFLEGLSRGSAGAWLTREAKATLARVARP
jgi:WD40 repeat protein